MENCKVIHGVLSYFTCSRT